MSITDLTPSLETSSQDTAAEWDVSEIDGSRVPEAPESQAVPPQSEQSQVLGTRPTFTITEAATACAVSRKTITRKLTDLAEHGAAKDDDGVWRIPVEALLAVGLHPGRSLPATPRPAASRPASSRPAAATPRSVEVAAPTPAAVVTQPTADPDVVTISRDRWDDLRLRLARAEAEAAERALALADARLALRALTAAPAAPHAHAGDPSLSGSGRDMSQPVPGVPAAAGWVMEATRPAVEHAAGAPGPAVLDPGAAPAVTVLPVSPPRKRRWWQSAG